MKHLIFPLFCALSTCGANAQIARWLIQASYDNVNMADGIDAIVTDSAGTKTLWTYEGERIASTRDNLYPFMEGRALTLKENNLSISGFFMENGTFINAADIIKTHNTSNSGAPISEIDVTLSYPYFSSGMLLVHTPNFFAYVTQKGEMTGDLYANAYPFFHGFASCQKYKDLLRLKDPYWVLVDANQKKVPLAIEGKEVSEDDIDFISSLNDEGLAIIVIKKRVYYFNGKDCSITPVLYAPEQSQKPRQARLDGGIYECMKDGDNGTKRLEAQFDKKNKSVFVFDKMLRLITSTIGEKTKNYTFREAPKKKISSPLKVRTDNNQYGLDWGSLEVLPTQFDEIKMCIDNKALVKLKGKYGMLAIDKDAKFRLRLNNGNDIAFLHQKFYTNVRVDMPTFISSKNIYIEMSQGTGVELDKTSRECKNTESGNFVTYKCVLNIPDSLPDEIIEIQYPIQVIYDGLRAPVVDHKVKAWFYKKFRVEMDESQKALSQGTLSFVFDIINEQRDEHLVKTDVSVHADSLKVEREDKMSETRYKYKVHNLNEGINNVVVVVREQGCPPVIFPFEVEYHKPVAKTRNKEAEEEKVVIKKKPKAQRPASKGSVPDIWY